MYDAITDFFISWMGLQSFVYIFFLGYLTLLIYFYGSEKWEKFSDFDKVGFSFLIGLAIWILLIRPLSSYLLFVWNTFFSFTNESYIATPPSTQQWTSFFVLSLFIVLFIALLRSTNENKPFFGFSEAFELTSKKLIVFWIIVLLSQLFLFIVLRWTGYKILSPYLFEIIFFNLFFPLSFFLFLTLNDKLGEYFEKIKGHFRQNRLKYAAMAIIAVLAIGIGSASGLFPLLFKPTIQDHGETISSITNDSRFTIGYMVGNGITFVPEELICKEHINKEYTIKTKMLSWAPIEPGFTITGAKRWINRSTLKEYAIINETYFIVNESRYQGVNVTVNGFRVIKLIRDKDYDFEVEDRKFGNKTEIDFTIINKMPHTLNLRKINLYTPIAYNLSDWSPKTYEIYDVVDKTPKNKLIFARLNANQSNKVTIFLEEIEIDTTVNSNNQDNH